jgi:hypothetical protein
MPISPFTSFWTFVGEEAQELKFPRRILKRIPVSNLNVAAQQVQNESNVELEEQRSNV